MKYLAQDVRQFLAGNLRLAELDAQPERVVLRPKIEQERLGASVVDGLSSLRACRASSRERPPE